MWDNKMLRRKVEGGEKKKKQREREEKLGGRWQNSRSTVYSSKAANNRSKLCLNRLGNKP
jgi:hypothetical protein